RSVPVMAHAGKAMGLVTKDMDSKETRLSPAELAKVYDLKNQVSVTQEGGTNILKIGVVADTPEFVAKLSNAVAEAYREENISSRNRQVDEAKLFVERQLNTIEENYRRSEQALLQFKEREGNVFLTDEARQALDSYSRLE